VIGHLPAKVLHHPFHTEPQAARHLKSKSFAAARQTLASNVRSNMRKLFLIVLTLLTGCQQGRSTLQPSDAARVLSSESKRFLSWNGDWKGTDIDTELEFHPDGTVKITHYGTGVDSTTGTYETDGETVRISAAWEDLVEMPGRSDWPDLLLRHDADHQYLLPARQTEALQYE
jgi:hypothetical protein